jgi:NAD(P)-dependent dehydrogenase (short-subunit alcohol dehydrogenase family)
MNDFSKKSVLVTGASSGIGNAIAIYLAKQSYTVLATVRKEADAESLDKLGLDNLKPLYPLDLTEPDQIHMIANIIEEQIQKMELPPLYAIINVAGGGQIAPIELMNIGKFREELEKRLVGPIFLLQKLLPLLRVMQGRVFWIATPSLLPVPYVADIHASDFAVNYLARTLNIELCPDGIKNVLIRCGGINTSSPQRIEKYFSEMFDHWPKEIVNVYKDRLIRLRKDMELFNKRRTDPEKVAMLVYEILNKKNPKTKYQVGYMSNLGSFFEKLPQSWADFVMKKKECW